MPKPVNNNLHLNYSNAINNASTNQMTQLAQKTAILRPPL